MIIALDEGWRVASHIGVAEWLQQSWKLCRANGVQNIMVLHRLSRPRHRRGGGIARGADRRGADRRLRHQGDLRPATRPARRACGRLLGLSATETELLPTLRVGEALWVVGRRSFLVQHRLSAFERELVDTDARMIEAGRGGRVSGAGRQAGFLAGAVAVSAAWVPGCG